MKTAKNKAISEAYQALGMSVPEHSDENGWVGVSVLQLAHVQELFYETKTDGKTLMARPILLSGLETNNGWIRIESEEDLPKEDCEYHLGYFKEDVSFFMSRSTWGLKQAIHCLKNEMYTHWRPVFNPNPPIY